MVLVYLLWLTFKEFSRKMNSPLSSVTGFFSIESGFTSPASYQVFLSTKGYMTSCALQKKQYFLPLRLPSCTSCTCSYVWYLTHVFPPLSLIASFPPCAHVECFTTLGTMVCFPALRICCVFSRPLHQLHVFPRKRPLCSRLHYINIFLLGRTTNNLPRSHSFFYSRCP